MSFSTGYRLGAAFAAILALFAAALLVELGALGRIAQAEDELARLDHAKHAAHLVGSEVREQYIRQGHVLIGENASPLEDYGKVVETTAAACKHLLDLAETDDERARAIEIARLAAASDEQFRREVKEPLERGDRAALLTLHQCVERVAGDAVQKVDELSHIFEARSAAALPRTETLRSQARLVTLVCFGLAIVVATMVGLWLMRSILRPIAALRGGTERVGAGDLQSRIDLPEGDEFAALAASFNQMTADLRRNQEALVRSHKLASIGQIAAGVA